MKTDKYTKVILTIIAIALMGNLLKSFITPANAATTNYVKFPINKDGTVDVRIVGTSEPVEINLKEVDRHAFFYAEPIEVKVKN